jgi:vancomycin resistance protein VanJ
MERQTPENAQRSLTNEGQPMIRVQGASLTQRRQYSLLTIIRKLFLALSACYALSMTLFLVARALIGERLPVIALLNIFLHLLLMPAFVLLPLIVFWRRWWLALNILILVVFFLASYGALLTPRSIAAAPDSAALGILTYNLHAETQEFDGFIEVIRASGADIVAVQELSPAAASRFSADLVREYPYQALHPQRYANSGQGILSRYPIVADKYWRDRMFPDSLGNQRAEIDFNGPRITLYNMHPLRPVLRGLSFDDRQRRQTVTSLLELTKQDNGPILIVGDFNMTDQTEDYRRIAASFSDTYREVGWGMGFTFPDADPVTPSKQKIRRMIQFPLLLRLDYIFHTDAFQALEANVWPESGGSDHHPVYARLALRGDNR